MRSKSKPKSKVQNCRASNIKKAKGGFHCNSERVLAKSYEPCACAFFSYPLIRDSGGIGVKSHNISNKASSD